MNIITIGDILWDVFPGGEHLGGASFNFSAHLAQLGHEVNFISAVGDDDRGRAALKRVRKLGLSSRYIPIVPDAATGHVTVSVSDAGQPDYVIHRPAAYDFARLDAAELAELAGQPPDWVCFGTLHQTAPAARQLTGVVAEACASARRFYDVNLRRDSYTAELVESLLGAADVVKLNDDEVAAVGSMLDLPASSPEVFCRHCTEFFDWEAAVVTQGAAGSSALIQDEWVSAPGEPVEVADTVGAGDAFSAAFLDGLEDGRPPNEILAFANRVGALVASHVGAIPEWNPDELRTPWPTARDRAHS